MAEITKWVKKIWKNRTTEFPTRRTLMKEDGSSEIVTVTRNEGTVSEEGDAFDADTMNNLEERIDAGFAELNGKLHSLKVTTNSQMVITSQTSVVLPSADAYYISASYGVDEYAIGITFKNRKQVRTYKNTIVNTIVSVTIDFASLKATVDRGSGSIATDVFVFITPLTVIS